jgi:hypothetical protein
VDRAESFDLCSVPGQRVETSKIPETCAKLNSPLVQLEGDIKLIAGDGSYTDSYLSKRGDTMPLKTLPTKPSLLKHRQLPAQTLKGNETNRLEGEFEYEQVFTFGERSCDGSWAQNKGKQIAPRPSKASPVQKEKTDRIRRIMEASSDMFQENDGELESESPNSKKHKRNVYHIPQQVLRGGGGGGG